jgi:hypothetical protein
MKNSRGLDDIADDIHELERASIFDMGDLLIEARAKCEPGEWSDWLDREFNWSYDSADRYMAAAKLAGRLRTVRSLKVAATTIYALAGMDDEALPDAVARLEAAAKQGRVTAERGRQIVELACLRHDYGDLPDETLRAIERVDDVYFGDVAENLIAALRKAKPATEAEASAIINAADEEANTGERTEDWSHRYADDKVKAEKEAEAILDGPPPELPPAEQQEEPQKFRTEDQPTAWVFDFDEAIETLARLRTRSVREFTGTVHGADTRSAVAEFIESINAPDGVSGRRRLEVQIVALKGENDDREATIAELRKEIEAHRVQPAARASIATTKLDPIEAHVEQEFARQVALPLPSPAPKQEAPDSDLDDIPGFLDRASPAWASAVPASTPTPEQVPADNEPVTETPAGRKRKNLKNPGAALGLSRAAYFARKKNGTLPPGPAAEPATAGAVQ